MNFRVLFRHFLRPNVESKKITKLTVKDYRWKKLTNGNYGNYLNSVILCGAFYKILLLFPHFITN